MLKSFVVLVLTLTITLSFLTSAAAQTDSPAIKADVERRIRERKEKVTVELAGGGKASGRITQAGNDSFTLDQSGTARNIAYRDVTRIKGKGWSTGKKVGILAGVGGAITGLILYIAFQNATRNN